MSRWRGAGLVGAGRSASVRTRTFRITTLVLVLAAPAGVIVPALVGDDGLSAHGD